MPHEERVQGAGRASRARARPFVDHASAWSALRRGQGQRRWPARSPTSGSCPSSRSWRSRSSWSASSPRSTPTPQDLLNAIHEVLPGLVGDGNGPIALDDRSRTRAGPSPSSACWRPLLRARLALRHARGADRGVRGAGARAAELLVGKLRDLLALVVIGVGAARQRRRSPASSRLRDDDPRLARPRRRARRCSELLAVALGLAGEHACSSSPFFQLLADPDVPPGRCGPARCSARSASSCSSGSRRFLLRLDQGLTRVPGLRHRADPAGLDQLLLPGRHVRRRVGPHLARGPRQREREARRRPEEAPRGSTSSRAGRPRRSALPSPRHGRVRGRGASMLGGRGAGAQADVTQPRRVEFDACMRRPAAARRRRRSGQSTPVAAQDLSASARRTARRRDAAGSTVGSRRRRCDRHPPCGHRPDPRLVGRADLRQPTHRIDGSA